MMSRREQRVLTIFLLVMVVVLIAAALLSAPTNWSENYNVKNKGPSGTHVVKELLEEYNENGRLIVNEKSLAEQQTDAQNYVFIGGQQYLDSAGTAYLADLVAKGNTALISARTLPEELVEYLYFYGCEDYEWMGFLDLEAKEINANIWHPNLELDTSIVARFLYYNDTLETDWQFCDRAYFCGEEDGFVPLGAINEDFINFARIPYGDGYFYLHTTPLLFSNISLSTLCTLSLSRIIRYIIYE